MKAVKIKVNFTTGERAGGINPRDKNLRCHPQWQHVENGYEIRIVLDGNVDQYRGVDGVEVLEGETVIDDTVSQIHAEAVESFTVYNPALLAESIRSKKISLDGISPELSQEQEAALLFARGALGVARKEKQKPPKACDICSHVPMRVAAKFVQAARDKRRPAR